MQNMVDAQTGITQCFIRDGATAGTYIGIISDAVKLLGKEAFDKTTSIGGKLSGIGTVLGLSGFVYSEFKTDYETQKTVDLANTVHSYRSKERGVFMALYAEIAMKNMLDIGRVKISKDGQELIWRDEEARREFYDAIWEIKIDGCSE